MSRFASRIAVVGSAAQPRPTRLFALNGVLNVKDGNWSRYIDTASYPGNLLKSTRGGVSFKTAWSFCESTQGTLTHATQDGVLTDAAANGLLAILRIQFGVYSPQWVFDAITAASGTLIPIDPTTNSSQSKSQLPAPWDPTYLSLIQSTITRWGALYDGNPTIYYVGVGGGGTIGEMNVPDVVLSAPYIAPPSNVTVTPTSGGTLTAGTSYYYTVAALTASGETYPAQTAGNLIGAAADATNKSMTVTWTAPSVAAGQAITGYHIYRTSNSANAGVNLKQDGTTVLVAAGTTTFLDGAAGHTATVGTTNPVTAQTAVTTCDFRSYVPGHSPGSPGTWTDVDNALISAWQSIIGFYTSAFTRTRLSIGLDNPINPDTNNPAVRDAIAAYAVSNIPFGRSILQQNFLTVSGDPAHDLMAGYVHQCNLGHQTSGLMSGGLGYNSTQVATTLAYFTTNQIDFFEMFGGDAVSATSGYQAAITSWAATGFPDPF